MYGLLLKAAFSFIQATYGNIYKEILEELGFSEQKDLDQFQIYSDKMFMRIARLVCDKTGEPENVLMEGLGDNVIEFFAKAGYHDLLCSLGRTFSDLLNELDNLHEYIRMTYPKIRAPSFICLKENSEGILLLYRSKRKGFSTYVKGALRGVASRYYGVAVTIDLLTSKEVGDRVETMYQLHFDNTGRYSSGADVILRDNYFKNKVIMADTIFDLYPFHVLFTEQMEVLSVGKGLGKLFPRVLREEFSTLFDIIRPDIEPTFQVIQHHLNNIFELNCILTPRSARDPNALAAPGTNPPGPAVVAPAEMDGVKKANRTGGTATGGTEENVIDLIMKGQMLYIDEWSCIMFVGFPMLTNPEQILRIGLYVSDLSLFDSSRDLVMAAAQDSSDRHLTTKMLSVKGDVVAEATHLAEKAKEEWQRVNYSLMPTSISQRLMRGEPPYSCAGVFEIATVSAIELVDDRLQLSSGSSGQDMFGLAEDVHREASTQCSKYDLFKVDAGLREILFVAGAPEPMKDFQTVCVKATLNLLQNTKAACRAGIATEMIGAGIVGVRLVAYRPFGPAVRLAHRLVSVGSPRRVVVDEQTANAVKYDPDLDVEQGADIAEGSNSVKVLKTFWVSYKRGSRYLST